jgi:hypothetical protein
MRVAETMARAWVPLSTVERRDLPGVCVKTGSAAERLVLVPARTSGRWTWMLFIAGVVPYLALRHLVTREIRLPLPFSASAAQRLAWARVARAVLVAGCPVAVLLTVADGRRAALLAGAGWLAGALASGILAGLLSVGARLDLSARGVLLRRVHPEFRDALGTPAAGGQATGQAQGVAPQRGQAPA